MAKSAISPERMKKARMFTGFFVVPVAIFTAGLFGGNGNLLLMVGYLALAGSMAIMSSGKANKLGLSMWTMWALTIVFCGTVVATVIPR
jgi:hypothetical protein